MAELTPEKREEYWRRTSRLMWIILGLWLLFSFIIPAFAVQLNDIRIFGFPLGFFAKFLVPQQCLAVPFEVVDEGN